MKFTGVMYGVHLMQGLGIDGISLSDCYSSRQGTALISGTQALVRLLLEQARLDQERGLNTRGLVSGYPGSPLGGLDLELGRSKRFLDEHGIVFQPGVNEELAATALWGSQHIGLYDDPSIDGVFALWYGKGPGLDRSMDALRHANQGGVAPKGGMVIAVGDDPTGKSSTLAYQSDHNFVALGIPYFFPRRVSDIIPMGLEAFALSRHAGCCVGLKIVVDTADASTVLDLGSIRPMLVPPEHQPGPVHVGKHDPAGLREQRLHELRLPAVRAWQGNNPVNAVTLPSGPDLADPGSVKPRLAIMAVGKAAVETREALSLLGMDQPADHGIVMIEVGMPWPLAAGVIAPALDGVEEILVVEEKRPLVEDQVARLLVDRALPIRLSGKRDHDGQTLLPAHGEISVEGIARAVAHRAEATGITVTTPPALADLGNLPQVAMRTPYYCAGCPHNSSTKLPEGEITGMGIGCHSISGFIDADNITNFTQMGGEGAFWIGRAPFSSHDHSFQNMGDGTFAHSGYLGVRAAIAAGVNTTFKLLYNSAVAMTGGQNAMGAGSADAIARQFDAEGATGIAVVSDDPEGQRRTGRWPEGTGFHHRRDIVAVQEDLARISGVTALIFVQTCAAELRRGRKRGKIPDRAERLFINEEICEGCGDCAVKSNCVAVKPVTRPEGVKRQIDQTVCNKDYSCLEGFCPSFVSVTTAEVESEVVRPEQPDAALLPDPQPWREGITNIFMAGIGGTGVSTLSAVLVMAARIEGISAQAVNQTGLSQKNGGVTSQVRMVREGSLDARMVRLPPRSADLLLGCDAVVAANDLALKCLDASRTTAIINARMDPVGVAGVGSGHVVDDSLVFRRLEAVMNPEQIMPVDTSLLSEQLLGSATFANVMLLGVALQKGLIPLSTDALMHALRLNGVAVADNHRALEWGRWLAVDADRVRAAAGLAPSIDKAMIDDRPADEAIRYFAGRLNAYDSGTLAGRYEAIMDGIMAAAAKPDDDRVARKTARALYRVMAIKDEYEVARLMTDPGFGTRLKDAFGSPRPVAYHLAPPLLGWLKNRDGKPRKIRFGGWMRHVFGGLKKLRFLRETPFDVFGYNAERRREWAFRDRVITLFSDPLLIADHDRLDAVCEAVLAVRGYGYVKEASMDAAEQSLDDLMKNKAPRPHFDQAM